MIEHLPALQIVIPLAAAPLCVLVRRPAWVHWFALAVVWAAFGIAVTLLSQTLASGPISYAMGSWAPPLGIEYRVDVLNAFVLVIVSGIASVVLPAGPGTSSRAVTENREYLFYAAFLLCMAGLLGVTITGDAFNVFVFLEISSLASYVLVSLGSSRRALMAAFSYLIVGTIGGTFILIGIGLAYQMTGTLNMADLAARLPDVISERTTLVAFGFLTVGIGIKLAVFPLHQWLPGAYSQAPTVVSAFLSATGTKVAYYLLVRFVFTIFGASFVFTALRLDLVLMPLSIAAMFIGSIAAIYQTDLKRLLAYSSIAQVGYMTLGLSMASIDGLTGGIVHLFNHALMKGGLFLVVACVAERLHSTALIDLRGIGKRMPITMAAFVIGGLSLVGVPGTAGFVSKWYLVLGALERGSLLLAFLILLSSLLAVVYLWRVVELAYFQEPDPDAPKLSESTQSLIPAYVLIAGTLYFGVFTEWSAGVARSAASWLMTGSLL